MERIVIEKKLSFSELKVTMEAIGDDWNVVVTGGDRPHIGCCVLAVPRLSLREDKNMSATASVLNISGHKDEILCRYLAEYLAEKFHAVVACSGGFHVDHIREEQIKEVTDAVKEIAEKLQSRKEKKENGV